MKSLTRRFSNIQTKNPDLSTIVCFSGAVRGGKFNKQTIRKEFINLVDRRDYEKGEKMDVLRFLYSIT